MRLTPLKGGNMTKHAHLYRPESVLRLAVLVTLLCLSQAGAGATPLVLMPGAPLLPAIPPPTGTIFDLTPVVGGVQTGSVIPGLAQLPAPISRLQEESAGRLLQANSALHSS